MANDNNFTSMFGNPLGRHIGEVDNFSDEALGDLEDTQGGLTNMVLFEEETESDVNDSDEIVLTTPEVINMIAKAVDTHPNILKLTPNTVVVENLQRVLEEDAGISLDLKSIIDMEESIRHFILFLTVGVICTPKTMDVIPNGIKVVFMTEAQTLSNPYVLPSNGGKMFKSKPIINNFSKAIFNNVVQQSYKNVLTGTQDVYEWIVSTGDAGMEMGTNPEMNFDLVSLSDIDIASLIVAGELSFDDISELPSNRRKNVKVIIEVLSDGE